MSEQHLGTIIDGTYRLDRVLGEGLANSVYEATDITSNRAVMVRLLYDANEAVFRAETKALAALNDDHVATLHAHGYDESVQAHFLVSDPMLGITLAERMRNVMAVEEVLEVGVAIATALRHAHANGVLHRDIKPQCVGIDGQHAKVFDFGLARLLDPDATAPPVDEDAEASDEPIEDAPAVVDAEPAAQAQAESAPADEDVADAPNTDGDGANDVAEEAPDEDEIGSDPDEAVSDDPPEGAEDDEAATEDPPEGAEDEAAAADVPEDVEDQGEADEDDPMDESPATELLNRADLLGEIEADLADAVERHSEAIWIQKSSETAGADQPADSDAPPVVALFEDGETPVKTERLSAIDNSADYFADDGADDDDAPLATQRLSNLDNSADFLPPDADDAADNSGGDEEDE